MFSKMPRQFKRNNIWSKKHQGNKYDEHDDRDRIPTDITVRKPNNNNKGGNRRVSFKTGIVAQGRLNFKGRNVEQGLRSQLIEEDDERMVDFDPSKASTFRRRNSPIPGSARNKTKLFETGAGWFQVTIPHGNKYDKDFILKSLLKALSPEIFIPHYWSVESNSVIFYIDDYKTAKILANVDRTIEMPNGFKLIIKVRNGSPQVKIDPTVRERMKLAMAKRYNAVTKALDLTQFHLDADLRDIYCGLSRAPIFSAASDIITENIAELEALNLDGNKINTLEMLKKLLSKLPNLKILYLSNNKIQSAMTLEPLKNSEIIDLVLKGNPLCDRFRDNSIYVREVRKRLPKLQKLDGVELPAQIGFDVETEETTQLPSAKASFLVDQSGADIVRQFLQQYFVIFDSDNRQPLLDAYHENAMFSLTCTYHPNPDFRITKFLPYNRNLKYVRDPEKRKNLLKIGRLPVVSYLSELPKTEHDSQSFAVDLSLFTPTLITLTVTGIFREKQSSSVSVRHDLRSFHRTMIIVPINGGFCIKNDILHITNLTMAQVKTAFKPIAPVPVTTGPSQPPVVPTPTSALNTSLPPDENTKLQMIEAMAQHSQMNLEWSRKCLEETNWDFQRAGHAFTELHKQNKIPPEAFIK
ncbi:nuclear RNA export factor 1 [Contarinia nasturtii]|uniref:nuclear RNA export factor 1 n=1 Tax=Contarinia nasturtii TaxID=265458 RepID=UPI0012D44149|nr:nuclear RNA export factor 1 [Contarinia nasturtii]